GTGNVTLWPEPEISWPASLHAYAGEEETQIVPQDGTIAGAKAVRYLVVPDSTGSILIPEVRYPFFDPGTRAYAVARVPPRTLSVAPGLGVASSRANLPPLSPRSPNWAAAMTREAWPWGWLVIVFAPPFLVLLARAFRRTGPDAPAPVPARVSATRLGKLERD